MGCWCPLVMVVEVMCLQHVSPQHGVLTWFLLYPVLQNDQGIVTHYVGIQTDVSAAADAGLLEAAEQMTEQQAAGAAWTVAVSESNCVQHAGREPSQGRNCVQY